MNIFEHVYILINIMLYTYTICNSRESHLVCSLVDYYDSLQLKSIDEHGLLPGH